MSGPVSKKGAKDKSASDGARGTHEKGHSQQTGSHDDLLALQHAAGNQAVNQLFQPSTAELTSLDNAVPSVVQDVLRSGSGQPLDTDTRKFMESRFGTDFSQVRVHSGTYAANSARFMGAEAYTAGDHIVFGSGKYTPFTPSGGELLTHELSHVFQMGSRMPHSLAPVGDPWENEAEHGAHALQTGTSAELSVAPPAVRSKLDPNLKSYVQNLRALAREPGIASQGMEKVAGRINEALKGLDIHDEDNLSMVADELARLFQNRVVTEFLVRYASGPLGTLQPSPEQRAVEQTEKRMQIRQPYKSGRHTPGTFFPSLFFDAFDAAVVPTVPPSLTKAVGVGALFVAGVYGGMSDSIEEEELRALTDKLNQAGLLTVAFPPIFLAGAAYGIAEDAIDFIKTTVGLFEGDAGLAVAAALEALQVLMSPEGGEFSYDIGKAMGREFAQQLRDALKQNLVHFTFSLGRLIGPTVVYLVLTLAGVPQALLARAFSKILPLLKQLLKNEARLLALIATLEKRLPRLPEKKPLPSQSGPAGKLRTEPPLTAPVTEKSPVVLPTRPAAKASVIGKPPEPIAAPVKTPVMDQLAEPTLSPAKAPLVKKPPDLPSPPPATSKPDASIAEKKKPDVNVKEEPHTTDVESTIEGGDTNKGGATSEPKKEGDAGTSRADKQLLEQKETPDSLRQKINDHKEKIKDLDKRSLEIETRKKELQSRGKNASPEEQAKMRKEFSSLSDESQNIKQKRVLEKIDQGNSEIRLKDLQTSYYEKVRYAVDTDTAYRKYRANAMEKGIDKVSGQTVEDLTVDHLVSVDEIAKTPGADKLAPKEIADILNQPGNLVPMKGTANFSKNNRSWAQWEGWKKYYGENPAIRVTMIDRENKIRQKILSEIEKLIKSK